MKATVFFHDFSELNRYRAGYSSEDKVRGFFHLQRYRVEPPREIAFEPEHRYVLAALDGVSQEAKCYVRPIVLQFKPDGAGLECLGNVEAEAMVMETEGSEDEFRVLVSGLRCREVPCRVLLMSEATLDRLRESVPEDILRDVRREEDVALLKTILSDGVLGQNEALMRRLAAVADVDVDVDKRGWIEASVAIPKVSPERALDWRVVIVIDCPRKETT